MPLQLNSMPFASCYDPAADAAGSADPLGSLGGSERLAEVILPGLTARMWRARLLTFAVVAADVADSLVRRAGDREDLRLDGRLAFERLFVSALVRCEEADPDRFRAVSRRVPGSRTARRALQAGDEPLTRRSFIRGQAVNGPSGVMARLARELGLLDDAGRVGSRGHDLRAVWLGGGEEPEVVRRAVECVELQSDEGRWPRQGNKVWGLLTEALRPDAVPSAERKLITSMLHNTLSHGIRPRVLQLLSDERCVSVYRAAATGAVTRGEVERPVLLDGLRPLLGVTPIDAHIASAIQTIDAYERFSVLFSDAFDALLWALRTAGGSKNLDGLTRSGPAGTFFARCQKAAAMLVPQLRQALSAVSGRGPFEEQSVPATLSAAVADAERASVSAAEVPAAVMARHERVQREKRKPAWVDRSLAWTLMPGAPIVTEPPKRLRATFIHPYRLVNAYSLLQDLGLVKGGRPDGEDDDAE